MSIIQNRIGLLFILLFAVCLGAAFTLPLDTNLRLPFSKSGIPQTTTKHVIAQYSKLPLSFEINQGQSDAQVKFLTRGKGYTHFFTANGATFVLQKPDANDTESQTEQKTSKPRVTAKADKQPPAPAAVLRMQLLGANTNPSVTGQAPLPGKVNYFRGNDPKQWRTDISMYQRVQYKDVYPNIDLVYYGNQGQLEYDFIVAPGADPRTIRLAFEGADALTLDKAGNLVLEVAGEQVMQQVPKIYQDIDGQRNAIAGGYVIEDKQRVSFQVASYDRNRPLVIDPILVYSTYLGGSNYDWGYDITVDDAGNAYITGIAGEPAFDLPTDFPTVNALQPVHGGVFDVFVTKINPDGSALIYSTYLGGSGEDGNIQEDDVGGIAVDSEGNVYVTGTTSSDDFPITANALQSVSDGSLDAFVAKLNATGSALVYSTYLGGSRPDLAWDIAVNVTGEAYVTGITGSTDFPTANPIQPSIGGSFDAFVAKLNATGSALVYSTYLGGDDFDHAFSIAVDATGNAYVTGATSSTDFPTANALQPILSSRDDAFVAKLNTAGSILVYSTYLGGSSGDVARGIAVDATGNAYVTGTTSSTDFPTANALQPALSGIADGFVTKLNPSGSILVYSTYLGGSGSDVARGIAVDIAANAFIAGFTRSADFPHVFPLQSGIAGDADAFVVELNTAGSALIYSTPLGGSSLEFGNGIAVDAVGNAYVTGLTASGDFPAINAVQSVNNGNADGFVAKISGAGDIKADLGISLADSPDPLFAGDPLTYTVTITNTGPDQPDIARVTALTPEEVTFVSATPSMGTCTDQTSLGRTRISCELGFFSVGVTATVDVVVIPITFGTVTLTAILSVLANDPNASNNTVSESTMVNGVPCDVDTDADVDRSDINLIFAARGSSVEPGDPRDADSDGVITINDGRSCVLQCTNPGCAS